MANRNIHRLKGVDFFSPRKNFSVQSVSFKYCVIKFRGYTPRGFKFTIFHKNLEIPGSFLPTTISGINDFYLVQYSFSSFLLLFFM